MQRYERKQGGAALIVSLVILLVMTVLGVAAMRGALFEEKMAGHFYDREKAFQVAEGQLRKSESLAMDLDIELNIPPSGCNGGICAEPDPNAATPRYRDQSHAGWSSWMVSDVNPDYENRYMIEYLGWSAGLHRLRVSAVARAKGQTGSFVEVQSVIRRP